MPFNDDDLKRLKALKNRYKDMECIPYGHADIDALLARLEAAEECVITLESNAENEECAWCNAEPNEDGIYTHEEKCEMMKEINAWHKAAGKHV